MLDVELVAHWYLADSMVVEAEKTMRMLVDAADD